MTSANAYVISKVVAQYFNPTTYEASGEMDYASQMLNYFVYNQNDLVRSYGYSIAQNSVFFSNNTFYDLDGSGLEKTLSYYSFSLTKFDYTVVKCKHLTSNFIKRTTFYPLDTSKTSS